MQKNQTLLQRRLFCGLAIICLTLPRVSPVSAEIILQNFVSTRDTWISQRQSGVDFGEDSTLKVGFVPASSTAEADNTQALLSFDLGTLAADATIESATVQVWAEVIQIEPDTVFHLAALDSSWQEENTAESLALKPFPLNLTPLSLRTITASSREDLVNNWISFDSTPELKALVQAWHQGEKANNGFVVYTTDRSNSHEMILTSREGENTAHHPLLKLSIDQLDKTPPVVEAVEMTTSEAGEAVVTWSTTEQASSYVAYGLTDEFGTTFGQDALTTAHRVVIKSLERGTPYHFQAKSIDESGNVGLSEDKTYTLDPLPSLDPPATEPVPEATEETEPTTAVDAPPPSTPLSGGANPTTPVNEKKESRNKPRAALSLAENADEYEPQGTEFSQTIKNLLILVAALLGFGVLLFIFRHTITGYLGTPEE